MGRLAFVFAGQGAQKPGMGQSLAARSEWAAEVFRSVDALRPGTSAMCFGGTAEDLAQTVNTQPCVYAVDLAAADALVEAGVRPDCVAGFSLGEIPALAFAGMLSRDDAFRFVTRRGFWMQQAGELNPGAMFAVLNLERAKLEALCGEQDGCYPVNYNAPGQIAVACAEEVAVDFAAAVAQNGGKALRLKVSGGFHSPLMQPAYEALNREFPALFWQKPAIPVYSNIDGEPYRQRDQLFRQIISPVRWEELICHMVRDGVKQFIEVGPGKTLTGLIKKIAPAATTLAVEDGNGLVAAVQAIEQGKESAEL